MTELFPYPSWKALNTALSQAAKTQAQATGQDPSDLMRLAYLDRFLARVFDVEAGEEWILKGGTGMLSRVPSTRPTKDVDLAISSIDLQHAQESLSDLVDRDIGDHVAFRFDHAETSIDEDIHPDAQGRRLFYRMYETASGKELVRVPVDLSVENAPVGGIEVVEPRHRLIPKKAIPSVPYRLYPVVDQIADKVLATMQMYGPGRPSTRTKDLVDLVVLARTQTVRLTSLAGALESHRRARGEEVFSSFTPPGTWARTYPAIAAKVEAVGPFTDLDSATKLVRELIDPALQTNPSADLEWRPPGRWREAGARA